MRVPRIAVLGSANMDLVVTVARAPGRGETVSGRSFRAIPGGKGANQALAARRAGASVSFVGAVGNDAYGAQLRALLSGEGIDVSELVTATEPTGTAHLVIDDAGENSIVVVAGANATVRSLNAGSRRRIADADVLLLQLELPLDTVAEAAGFARANGVRTILTPAPARELPRQLYADVDLLVPNQHEAATLSGTGDPDQAGRALLQRGCDVLITLGERGCRYFAADAEPVGVPAFAVRAVDTTAAGDSFVGAFAVATAEADDLHRALRRAAAAAALTVGRVGASAAIPHHREIEQFLNNHPE